MNFVLWPNFYPSYKSTRTLLFFGRGQRSLKGHQRSMSKNFASSITFKIKTWMGFIHGMEIHLIE